LDLLNLPCRQLEAEPRRRLPDDPTVRLLLEPGEGYRLPRGAMVLDGYSGDKQGPEVLLLISLAKPK
jgi:hypothetical protein